MWYEHSILSKNKRPFHHVNKHKLSTANQVSLAFVLPLALCQMIWLPKVTLARSRL